jgi:hypothetical protein
MDDSKLSANLLRLRVQHFLEHEVFLCMEGFKHQHTWNGPLHCARLDTWSTSYSNLRCMQAVVLSKRHKFRHIKYETFSRSF